VSSCHLFFHQFCLIIRSFINLSPNFHILWITYLKTKALCVIDNANKLKVFPFQCNNGAWRSPGILPLPFIFNIGWTYVGSIRDFMYKFISVTKYNITKIMLYQNFHTYALYSMHSHHCMHTFPIYVANYQLQLCIHPFSDDVKRQLQQRLYHLPIQIIHPEYVLPHVPATSKHIGLYMDSREDILKPLPRIYTRFSTSTRQ
jgi:hypothetical protein